jgi:hypothetical protein
MTGNKKHIHGMMVTGMEIDRAIGPRDFMRKEIMEIYNVTVNIMALPGMLGSSQGFKETSEYARNTTKMVATLITSAVSQGRSSSSIHDSMWQFI